MPVAAVRVVTVAMLVAKTAAVVQALNRRLPFCLSLVTE
jgi:hypothetical protein